MISSNRSSAHETRTPAGGHIPAFFLGLGAFILFLCSCASAQHERLPAAESSTETTVKPSQENPDPHTDSDPTSDKSSSQTDRSGKSATHAEDNRPDAQGRPLRTSFYGAELVREKVIVDGIPVTRISIRGGAVLKHNDVLIYAPTIQLDGGTKGRCLGGVRIVDKKNGLTIRAGRADYDRDKQTLALEEDPVMTLKREKETVPAIITATRMVRQMGERKSILEKDVRIYQKPWTLLADSGVFHDEGEFLELPDSPVLLGPDGFMTSGQLRYFVKDRYVRMETDVVLLSRTEQALPGTGQTSGTPSLEEFARAGGQLPVIRAESKDTDPTGEPKEEDPTTRVAVLSGDKLDYRFPKEGDPVIQVNGNVRLSQRDTLLETNHMRAEGKDFQRIVADQSVQMLERKNNIRVNAGRMVYDRSAGLLRLDQEPRMEFLKKGTTEVSAELTAQVIERDTKEDRTTARGDVRIVRGVTEATGAHADYDRRADVIVLDGSPQLVRGKSRIACEQILIFPARNRVLMKNRISGTLLE